jgi:2-C-methyl-D-erythritol 4-phosphate cytidylyltransferase
MPKINVGAIIVAAGKSQRMDGVDKVMATLRGKPVLAWSVDALQNCDKVDRIVLVNSQKNMEPVECLAIERKWSKVTEMCIGGRRRQDSVAAGLKVIGDCEWIIIHDGSRPLLTRDLIERGLEAARETGAAVAAVPVTDTIKLAGEDHIVIETPPRSRLWSAQTPQVFRSSVIQEAYRAAQGEVTDDATLVEQAGTRVKIYMGSYDNIKITTPRDLAVAEILIEENAE